MGHWGQLRVVGTGQHSRRRAAASRYRPTALADDDRYAKLASTNMTKAMRNALLRTAAYVAGWTKNSSDTAGMMVGGSR